MLLHITFSDHAYSKSLDPNVIQVNPLQMANTNLDTTQTSKRKTLSENVFEFSFNYFYYYIKTNTDLIYIYYNIRKIYFPCII